AHRTKLHFYGFDIPTSATGNASPRPAVQFVVDYLSSIDEASGEVHRQRIEALLGSDADWENPAQYADHTKSVGLSPAATSLRIALEGLITELLIRRPELIGFSDAERHAEALHYASVTRQHLNYHAAVAGKAGHGG